LFGAVLKSFHARLSFGRNRWCVGWPALGAGLIACLVFVGCAGVAVADTGSGYAVTTFAGGFDPGGTSVGPTGSAFDAAGNAYVADYGSNALYKFPADCTRPCAAGASTLVARFDAGANPIGGRFDRASLRLRA
jgi:hypothetical protein